MRLSPKSVFFGIVSFGFPFAVTIGWMLGTPSPAPPAMSAPGGAGGIGAAPTKATTPDSESIVDWSPRAPKPVAAESSVAGTPVSAVASAAVPSAVVSESPLPTLTLTLPPVPTPTAITTAPPSPSATMPSASAEPVSSGLGAVRLVRGP